MRRASTGSVLQGKSIRFCALPTLTIQTSVFGRCSWRNADSRYYPLTEEFALRPPEVVAGDLDRVEAIAGGMPILLMEAGYPSDGCGGTPADQQAFVAELLREAGRREQVRLVSLTWLGDVPEAVVEGYVRAFGVDDGCFRRFLGSLGLRSASGAAKPALDWLGTRR